MAPSLSINLSINTKLVKRQKKISLFTAEKSLTKFYKQFGFIEDGEVYFDDIPYVNMVKPFEEMYYRDAEPKL